MNNQVIVNEIKEIESQVGVMIESVLSLLKTRAEKILEDHQEFMPAGLYEDMKDNQDKRYAEIKEWLFNEYIIRFNHELFLGHIESVPIIPTQTDSYVDQSIIADNRKNFAQYFFDEAMFG